MNPACATIPNFFIAGAPKAGTTSLYYALRQHPDIYMSPMKEPSFFAQELRPENFIPEFRDKVWEQVRSVRIRISESPVPDDLQGVVTEWADYLKLFAGVQGERAIGEGSVCYLWSKTAPAAIAECNPDAKFIVILRNPVDRAFSQYRSHAAGEARPQSFRKHIEQSIARGGQPATSNPLLQFGLYADQLERYSAHFPERQVRVWIYEDTLRDPAAFLRQVFEFLEVDAGFLPTGVARHKEVKVLRAPSATRFLRNKAIRTSLRDALPSAILPAMKKLFYKDQKADRMSSEDRLFLIDYYRDDITRLASLIHRDLSSWLM